MRPDIYPRTLENIKAVMLYYFPDSSHSEVNKNAERIYDQRRFKLNELEYAAYIISKNESLIREYYNALNMNILLVIAHELLFEDESSWGTNDRGKKLRGIKERLVY